MQGHDEMESLAEGYALSALDPEEIRAFESHLASCDECARRVGRARAVVQLLPIAVEERFPRPELRNRVLGAVRAYEAGRPEPVGPSRWLLPRRAWAFLSRPVAAVGAAAVLLVLTVGLGAWNLQLRDDVQTSQVRLSRTYQAIEIMGKADSWREFSGTDAAPGAVGTIASSSSEGASCLIVWNLPQEPQGHYRAWAVKDGVPTSAGYLWTVQSGKWAIIPGEPRDIDQIIVTRDTAEDMVPNQSDILVQVSLSSSP